MPDVTANAFIEFISQYGIWLFGMNLGLSFIGAAMAKKRGYSYGGFLCLGIFISFLVGIIVAACLRPKAGSDYFSKPKAYVQAGIACKQCGALCALDMVYCPKCGRKLRGECKSCGSECTDDMTFCPKCGSQVSDW